jgi:RNA polymerase sigma-70 factor (ECF subfamily)
MTYAYNITYRYANDEQEANSLVNDSFLKLFRHIDVCKLDKSTNILNSFKGWFKKIIVNTCIDRYRSTKNTRQHEIENNSVIVDNSENGEDKLSYKEIINAGETAIHRLPHSFQPARDRRIFT